MTRTKLWLSVSLMAACCALPAIAQQQLPAATSNAVVPPLTRFSGSLTDINGKALSGVTAVTFALYKDSEGGAPLWLETQNVYPDKTGHYSVTLGSTTSAGIPASLFATGEAHWLGVQVQGQAERNRVLLMSVPYALKAMDAETLGGQPASAFLKASATQQNNNPGATITGSGKADYLTRWVGPSKLGISDIFEASSGDVGIATNAPAATLDVNGTADLRNTLTLFPNGNSPALSVNGSAFSVSSTGLVNFASGQTFPGVGTISGITAGADLTGGGTSGNVTLNLDIAKVPLLAAANSFAASQSVAVSTSGAGIYVSNANTTTGDGIDITVPSTAGAGVNLNGGFFGVLALNSAYPIIGESAINEGVFGSNSNTAAFSAGILGEGLGTQNMTIGVRGITDSLAGAGVVGTQQTLSQEGGYIAMPAGVWGDGGAGGYGVPAVGVLATVDDGEAVLAHNNSFAPTISSQNDYPGYGYLLEVVSGGTGNYCNIDSTGSLYCDGTVGAIVDLGQSARKVALSSVQSPESWMEDAGSGVLSSGATTIQIDPDFAQTVNTGVEYHVYLTPEGECEGLYVSQKSATGFEVHELHSGRSNVAFDYRIMAKRKGYENVRMSDMTENLKKLKRPEPRKTPLVLPASSAPPLPTRTQLIRPVSAKH
jgi:hypothetical protein